MDDLHFEPCLAEDIQLGEGPVWDDARNVLWFVDILRPAVFSYDPSDRKLSRHDMPDLVTSIGLTADERLILSLRKDVCLFTPASGVLQHLVTPEPDRDMNRLNDGKVGPDGAFWVGSMFATRPSEPTGALYRITPDGGCARMIDGIHVSNGLAWSPDHRTLYHADSRGPYIKAWDFDPRQGRIAAPRILATLSDEEGLPDGAAVDVCGNYWSAGVTAGCLHVYAPTGALLRRISVPMAAPTMPCFGGADGQTLFLTGLTRATPAGASPGGLYAARTGLRGAPVARFGIPLVTGGG